MIQRNLFNLYLTRTAGMLLLMLLTAQTAWADDIVITSENFTNYFDYDGDFEYATAASLTTETGGYFLKNDVPAGSTLDFRGEFIPDAAAGNTNPRNPHNPRIFINKRVNITSSDKSAVFKPYANDNDTIKLYWNFGILEGADNTEVKNLQFQNCWVFNHGSSYVTFDGIDLKVEDIRIGSGIGALSIRTIQEGGHASDHTTVKNSNFYFRNNGGSSCISAACGAPYATFDHNTVTLEGKVGNGIYANTFNSYGEAPEFSTFTNNVITNDGPANNISYCIVVCGQGNLVENNTVNYAGNAITMPFGSASLSEDSEKNIYRNNTTTLGGSMSVYTYSVVENNQISGELTVAKGATATGNTVAGMTVSQDATVKSNTVNGSTTISGTNVTFQGNTVNGAVTIEKTTASFADNVIYGTVTLNSASGGANDNNTITGNVILSLNSYAVELKSSNNTVSGNMLISYNHKGDAAVNTSKTNTISDNTLSLKATADPDEQYLGNSSTITFDLYTYAGETATKYDGSLNIQLNLTQTLGELDKTTASLGEEITYTAKEVGNGKVIGTFGNTDITVSDTIPITVSKIPTEITIEKDALELEVLDEVATGATLTPADAGNLVYTSSDEDVAIVKEGKIIALAEGTATITVSFAGDDTYAAAESKTVALSVSWPSYDITIPAGLSTYYEAWGLRIRNAEGNGEGVKIYAVTNVSGDKVTLKEIANRTIPASTPVIISNAGNSAVECAFEWAYDEDSENQFAQTFASDLGTATLAKDFVGTAEVLNAYVPDEGITMYGFNGEAFVRLDEKPDIAAHRCWLEIPVTASARTRTLTIVFDDGDTTGIQTPPLTPPLEGRGAAAHSDARYNLQGQRVADTYRGIVIQNGKKYLAR